MGHYMDNDTAVAKTEGATGLDSMDARREIKRIADAVVDRSMPTEKMLTECAKLAEEYYVVITEVYKKVWKKAKNSPELHPTHPAGKTPTYHKLRELATAKRQ